MVFTKLDPAEMWFLAEGKDDSDHLFRDQLKIYIAENIPDFALKSITEEKKIEKGRVFRVVGYSSPLPVTKL